MEGKASCSQLAPVLFGRLVEKLPATCELPVSNRRQGRSNGGHQTLCVVGVSRRLAPGADKVPTLRPARVPGARPSVETPATEVNEL